MRLNLRFYPDPETGLPHIYEHGVSEEEVCQVLERHGERRKGDEDSWVATGQTAAGRYLRVIYVRDPEPNSVFVITAYEIHGKTLKAHRRRRRRKRK